MPEKPSYDELQERVRILEREKEERKRAERALRESESKFQRTFDQSPIGAAIVGPDHRFQGANEEFCRFIGYSEEELLSLSFVDITHPFDLDSDLVQIRRLEREEINHYQTEKRYIRKDGEVVWGKVSVRIIRDEKGRILCHLPLVEDITEKKLAEQALKDSERKYRNLFDESLDAIFMTTREGRFVEANRAMLELFGFTKKELLDKINVGSLYTDRSARERFRKHIERDGSVRNYALKLLRKDGTVMDCILNATVRRSHGDQILGYQGIIRDISEHIKSEKALRVSEARYRAIVEDQTELICRFLADKRLTFVNEAYCKYFGLDRETLIGSSFMHLIPEQDHEKLETHFSSLTPDNPVATHEYRIITQNGEVRWQLWTNRIFFDETGGISEYQAVGRDITERKLMEEALKESSEKVKLFAYCISHDLKSPAVSIHGLTRQLYRSCAGKLGEREKELCRQILAAAEQIAMLAENVNVYISTKEVPLRFEIVQPNDVLRIIKEEFSRQLEDRRIRWLEPSTFPEMKIDRLSLLRILKNLVENALKYGGDSLSEIRVGYRSTDDHHILSISDNGIGLKGEGSDKIFGVFQRYKTSKGIEGTGLGLSIVKEAAERHHGSVWVEPGPDDMTTFHVSFSKAL